MLIWIKARLYALDIWINYRILGGDDDETISSRLGRTMPNCMLCRWTCAVLDLVDRDHCHKAAVNEQEQDS